MSSSEIFVIILHRKKISFGLACNNAKTYICTCCHENPRHIFFMLIGDQYLDANPMALNL